MNNNLIIKLQIFCMLSPLVSFGQAATYVKETFNSTIPYNTSSPNLRVTTADWLQQHETGATGAPNDFEWVNAGTYPVAANQNIAGFPAGAGFARFINRTAAYPAASGAASGDAAVLITRALDFSGHTVYNAAGDTLAVSIWRDNTGSVSNVLDYTEVYINTNPTVIGATLLSELNTSATKIYRSTTQSPVASAGWNRYRYSIPNLPAYVSSSGGSSNVYIIIKGVSAGGNNIYLDNFNLPQWTTPMQVLSAQLIYQDNNDIYKSSSNNLLLGIKVMTKGSTSPLKLDAAAYSTNGSTNWANDVQSSSSWFTSATSAFAVTGGAVSMPAAAAPVTGVLNYGWWSNGCPIPSTPPEMTLNPGSENYVWFAVDVKASAIAGDYIGADFQFATVRPAGICTFSGYNTSSTNLSTNPVPAQTFNKVRKIAFPYATPIYTTGTNNDAIDCISAVYLPGENGTQIQNYNHDVACSTCLSISATPQFCIRVACNPPSYTFFPPYNQGPFTNRFVQLTIGKGIRTGTASYILRAQAGISFSNNNIAVFIDWNGDGDFDDKYHGTSGIPAQDADILENYGTHTMLNGNINSYPVSGWPANTTWTINVPAKTDIVTDLNDPMQLPNNSTGPIFSGNVRMRIREVYASSPVHPYSSYSLGEAEDYTLQVLDDCPAISAAYRKWIGNTSDWNSPSNWCSAVPTINEDAVIPLISAPFVYPIITPGVNAACRSLKLLANSSGVGAHLNIDASHSSSLTVADSVIIGDGSPSSGCTSQINIKDGLGNVQSIPGKSSLPPAGIALAPQTPFRTNAQGKTQISYTAAELAITYGWKAGDIFDSLSIEVSSITTAPAGPSSYQNFRILAFFTSSPVTYTFPVPSNTKIAVAPGDPNIIAGYPKTIYSNPLLTLNMPNASNGTQANGNYHTFALIPNNFIWDGTSNLVLSFEYNTDLGAAPAKNYILYNEANYTFSVLSVNYNAIGSVVTGWDIDGAGHYSGGSNAGITATVSNQRPRLDFKWHHIYETFPVTVGGYWINHNPSGNGFVAGNSEVIFNGNKNVKIAGYPTTFSRFTLSKSISNNKVTLSCDMIVDSVLYLVKGKLKLNQKMVTVNYNDAGAIVRKGGFIQSESSLPPYGYINWNIGSDYSAHVFPFGSSNSNYIPLIYKQFSGNAGYVKASTYNTGANNLPYPTSVTNVNDTNGNNNSLYTVDRFWTIDRTNLSGNARLTFSYTNNESPAPITPGNVEVNHYDFANNKWERFSNTQTNVVGATVSKIVINAVSASNFVNGVWALSDMSSPLRIDNSLDALASVYPNPFNDYVKVEMDDLKNETVNYFIYDAAMRRIVSGQLREGNNVINTNMLLPGAYIIKLLSPESTAVQKIIKM